MYKLCLLFLLLVISLRSESQENSGFRILSIEEGLHSSIVYAIAQDKDGLVWLALRDGIDKFNGYDFKHYDVYLSLSGDYKPITKAEDIIKDGNDLIWAGTDQGLLYFDYRRDLFIEANTGFDVQASMNRVTDISVDNAGKIWLGTNIGVIRYDPSADSGFVVPGFFGNVLAFYQAGPGRIWFATNRGITAYSADQSILTEISRDEIIQKDLSNLIAHSFEELPGRKLLIGTNNNGLVLLDRNTSTLKHLNQIHSPTIISVIKDIEQYDNGEVLVATDGQGMFLLDADLNLSRQYILDEDVTNTLSNNGVYDIFVDSQKRIWASTYGGGLNLLDPNIKPFTVINHILNNPQSLRNNTARAVTEDNNNRLWFGTKNGLSILDRETMKWKHIGTDPDDPNSLTAGTVLSLICDSRGMIWAGTYSGGIDIYHPSGKKVRNIRSDPRNENSLGTNHIYSMYEAKEGHVWVGGIFGGLTRYDPNTGIFEQFDQIINVHCITEGFDNRILVGTLDGIYISDQGGNTFHLYQGTDPDSLPFKARVFCLHYARDQRLWVGTEGGGIKVLDMESRTHISYKKEDGLPSDIVYGILEDQQSGMFWLSTTNGLCSFDPESEEFSVYSTTDGISSREFNYGAWYKTSKGEMIFGGTNGFTLFRPEEIKLNEDVPEIVFSDFYIFNRRIEPSDPGSEFSTSINETSELVLDHNRNSISIEFAAVNYTSSQKNRYRWKLEGLPMYDESWTPASTERRATFTSLPPGDYVFRVQASNNDGLWNYTGRDLDITIKPPFWWTPFAKVIYLLMILFIFAAIQRFIILNLNEKQAMEKIRFFINIAHDIRTPLTLIRGPIQTMVKDSRADLDHRKNLQLVSNNTERLNNLVNQLLDFQKADLGKLKLSVGQNDLIGIIEQVISNFESFAEENNIRLKLVADMDKSSCWCDRQKIERIMYNLISNAIKYSYEMGEVEIRLVRIGSHAEIRVVDHGRGIPQAQQKKIFNRYYRSDNAINAQITGSGVGLMLTKKLVDLHKGDLKFSSREKQGSTFIFKFPVERQSYSDAEIQKTEVKQPAEKPGDKSGKIEAEQRKKTILILEDNDDLRMYLHDQLSDKYRIELAVNGKEGLSMIEDMEPDLIISDIMMPEMDGIEFLKKIRSSINTSHVPLILLTSLSSVENKIIGLEHGADDYIEKPFDIELLGARIENLLLNRQRLRKKYLEKPDQKAMEGIKIKKDQELMEKIRNVVEENYFDSEFSVESMCEKIGMSRPVLYRKIKAYTDLSPQDYIKILRLKCAKELLRTTPKSIKEIAYEVGFSDPKYFSVSFKKFFGESPSSFQS